MSLSNFIKLVNKAFRFTFSRPIQRFNIYNRAKKFLGPDAEYFKPAPRAIGAMSQTKKPIQYPHLEAGYKSIRERRLKALEKEEERAQLNPAKSYSESESDDRLVIGTSNQLEVTKTIVPIRNTEQDPKLIDGEEKVQIKSSRPLPKCTNLPLSDPAAIWQVDKVTPGRLSLSTLQELMVNRLADDSYWTPKAISERYNIKEEYSANLVKYMKQIRIVVSPRMAKLLDYVGREDPYYQSAKHVVYHVDKSLRTNADKQYDKMFLPGEQLEDEVKELIDFPTVPAIEPKKAAKVKLLKKKGETNPYK